MPEVNDVAPDFQLATQDGTPLRLSDLRGKSVVLYFYPKDDTPGCTRQACGLRDSWDRIREKGAVVLGVSPDSVAAHVKFRRKYELPFTLLADSDHEVAGLYGVWKEKSRYGRKYWGNERTTFIIDGEGRIRHIFPRVKPEEHAEQVLAAL
jgi:peroxiredoxin Q/BCP